MIVKSRHKKDSWEHYCFLLEKHDFNWRQSSNQKLFEAGMDMDSEIERLRKLLDCRSEMYNQYSPSKK